MKENKDTIIAIIIIILLVLVIIFKFYYTKDNEVIFDNINNDNTLIIEDEIPFHQNQEFLREIFNAKEVIAFSDQGKFPYEITIQAEGVCSDNYITPVGYTIKSCQEDAKGMKNITLFQSRKLPGSKPSFINSINKTDKINIAWYNYNPNREDSYCDGFAKNEIASYFENDGLGLFSYKQHIGGGYGTYVKFEEDYYLEYVGLKFSAGVDIVESLYLEFIGSFPFTSSEINPSQDIPFISTAQACSSVDSQGIGSYILSSELAFYKEEDGVRWYYPLKKIKVDEEIRNMQISLYKKDRAIGSLMVELDNMIFSQNSNYYYLNNNGYEVGGEDGYNQAHECQFGDFYYGVFPGIESGNISFRYDKDDSNFYISFKNNGDGMIIFDSNNISAMGIRSIQLFTGENFTEDEKLFIIDMSFYSDFSKTIIGKKLLPGEVIEVPYKIGPNNLSALNIKITKNNKVIDEFSRYRDIQWSIGDPYIYSGDIIKVY